MKKKIFITLFILIAALILFNFKLLIYGIQQGWGQLNVIIQARPISEILADESQPDSLKTRLRFTLQVRDYAMKKLGLNDSDNYTTFYDQGGEPILWNLSASEPYELKPYLWKFPFLGSVPYKGFFKLDLAKKEREKLMEKGYDTRIREVSGWSTLGILKDPILSNMIERGEGQLAEVIIHELVHATIFLRDQIDFNENLASFIGEIGAQEFLREHFGDSSEALIQYQQELEDSDRLKKHMLLGTQKLDHLYKSLANKPDSIKAVSKTTTIKGIVDALDTVTFSNDRYYHIFDKSLPNNAYFMSFLRYHSKEDSLRGVLNGYQGDISKMIEALKERY